jgi:hypothetical protein
MAIVLESLLCRSAVHSNPIHSEIRRIAMMPMMVCEVSVSCQIKARLLRLNAASEDRAISRCAAWVQVLVDQTCIPRLCVTKILTFSCPASETLPPRSPDVTEESFSQAQEC